MSGAITDIHGIKVGHYTDKSAVTGCTVILCEQGAVAGIDVRGSAPGTRETDSLHPMNLVERIHAITLSGGSAFGLDAAGGVMRYLEERGIGFEVGVIRVPIVPAAIIFDLEIGSASVRPGAEEGYQACLVADKKIEEGCVGAGTGATVGKICRIEQATKGGLGTASQKLDGNIIVGALAVVNCFGDVIDPQSGKIIAGPRPPQGYGFLSTVNLFKSGLEWPSAFLENTTLGVVATNAHLNKEQVNKLAQMAHDGLARTINPCHTMLDGDVVFALSIGEESGDVNVLGTIAAEVIAKAIIRAVVCAESLGGIPGTKDVVWRN